jgi:hypothetical protein
MTGIIVTSPPTVELPPGNSGSGPNSLPGVTYQYAVLTIPQTWTALQTYNAGRSRSMERAAHQTSLCRKRRTGR